MAEPMLAIRLYDEDIDTTAIHPVLGSYVEHYWGSRLGPTSICAVRRMVTLTNRDGGVRAPTPCAVSIPVRSLEKLLGLSQPGKIKSTLARLERFSPCMVREIDAEYTMVAIPLRWSTVPTIVEREVEAASKVKRI